TIFYHYFTFFSNIYKYHIFLLAKNNYFIFLHVSIIRHKNLTYCCHNYFAIIKSKNGGKL
ncbi:hypothetical protein C3P07_20445, partial [Clostridioides difficile]